MKHILLGLIFLNSVMTWASTPAPMPSPTGIAVVLTGKLRQVGNHPHIQLLFSARSSAQTGPKFLDYQLPPAERKKLEPHFGQTLEIHGTVYQKKLWLANKDYRMVNVLTVESFKVLTPATTAP